MSQPTDTTPTETAFDAVATALAPLPPVEAESLLAYMLASVAAKRRAGLPQAGVRAELAELVGRALEAVGAAG